jgi:hypothetical protein
VSTATTSKRPKATADMLPAAQELVKRIEELAAAQARVMEQAGELARIADSGAFVLPRLNSAVGQEAFGIKEDWTGGDYVSDHASALREARDFVALVQLAMTEADADA